jgi:hypothetical protein
MQLRLPFYARQRELELVGKGSARQPRRNILLLPSNYF